MMSLKQYALIFSCSLLTGFCLPVASVAQIGGDNTYEFLNLVPSARISAMGGKMVPVRDNDLNLIFGNPALLNALTE